MRETCRRPRATAQTPVLAATVSLARAVFGDAEQAAVVAIGVGATGQIDAARGVVGYAGPTMPGWTGADIGGAVRAAFALPVAVENDVNALALGEAMFGAARGLGSALFVAVGTGVGGALVLNGELWRGHSSSAGEIGRMLFDAAHASHDPHGATIEAYAAGPAMAARYCERIGTTGLSLREVHARALNGDARAREVIGSGAAALGRVLASALNVVDPEALIIGGGVAALGALWWEPLLVALRANPQPGPAAIRVLPAALGTAAPLAGAGAVGWRAR